jgi:hypothetical protein
MPDIRFLADVMLGKLATWLRILGYDTEYCRTLGCAELLSRARIEDRQILTRNTRLGMRTVRETRVCLIRANDPMGQLREVLAHYRLVITPHAHLTLCLICNRKLVKSSPEMLVARVPEYVLATRQVFLTCPACQKVYWRGTHYQNIQERIKQHLMDN